MAIVFGNVPHPPFIDRLIPDAQNTCFDNLGQRNIMGVVYHRMLGSLAGTDNFFRTFGNSHAHFEATGEVIGGLTDYGVDHETGEIRRWNDPHGDAHPGVSANRAAWASGPVSAPFGDGKAFLNDHGGDANIVNRDQASIEISGFFVSDGHPVDDPISDECKNSVAALSAYWADQFRIPWNKYPKVPGKDYNFTRWHQEYCIGSGKICPGQLVMNETTDIINRTKKIMKKFQEGGGEQPVVDDNKLKKFAHEREFHTKQGAISRKEATRNSPVVKNFQQGETITCVGFVHGEFVTEFNSDRWLQLAGPQKLKMHASGVVEPI